MSRWNLAWLIAVPMLVLTGIVLSEAAPSKERDKDYKLVKTIVDVLAEVDVQAEFLPGLAAGVRHVGERRGPVDVRLARAEAAQVRAVEHEDLGHRPDTSAYACSSSSSGGLSRMPGLASPSSTTSRSLAARVFLSTAIAARSAGQASAR